MKPLIALTLSAVLLSGCVGVTPTREADSLKIASWNMEHLAERDGEGCSPRTERARDRRAVWIIYRQASVRGETPTRDYVRPMTSADPKPKKKKTPRYQKRLVLFLDFLGFKEHVERSAREPAHLARLVAAMDIVGGIGASHKGVLKSQKVTQFSDSIVVSYKVSEPSAVFLLLNEIAFGVLDLAERGFLVRGGVTVGKLYHSKRHVVGPAMNEAYRLESKVAKHPRVLIDPKVLEVARAARRSEHSPDDEAGYVSDFMTRDTDGHYFFDYISWRSVVAITGGDNDLYADYLGCLSILIRDGLRHDGERLNPRKADLQLWRETFAAALRDRSVEAEATPRRARGVVRKAERTPVRKLRERFERGEGDMPEVMKGALKAAATSPSVEPPWEARLRERQAYIRRALVVEAVRLQASKSDDDRQLGLDLERFIRTLPPVATQREILARALAVDREAARTPGGRSR